MTWYEIFKDTLKLAQTVNNAELYDKMIELRGMMSEMQDEIDRLKDENRSYKIRIQELEEINILKEDIELHEDPYITLKNDPEHIKYCAVCWNKDHKLIPVAFLINHYNCPICKSKWTPVR